MQREFKFKANKSVEVCRQRLLQRSIVTTRVYLHRANFIIKTNLASAHQFDLDVSLVRSSDSKHIAADLRDFRVTGLMTAQPENTTYLKLVVYLAPDLGKIYRFLQGVFSFVMLINIGGMLLVYGAPHWSVFGAASILTIALTLLMFAIIRMRMSLLALYGELLIRKLLVE